MYVVTPVKLHLNHSDVHCFKKQTKKNYKINIKKTNSVYWNVLHNVDTHNIA